jgi:hypothetical protein
LLFRIGTFQWVTADSNKKILSLVTLWLKYHKSRFSLPLSHRRRAAGG